MRTALIAACVGFLLCGCGKENRETRLYGPEAAAIAGDSPPWQNERFHGDARAWDQELEKRARLQNEYTRIR